MQSWQIWETFQEPSPQSFNFKVVELWSKEEIICALILVWGNCSVNRIHNAVPIPGLSTKASSVNAALKRDGFLVCIFRMTRRSLKRGMKREILNRNTRRSLIGWTMWRQKHLWWNNNGARKEKKMNLERNEKRWVHVRSSSLLLTGVKWRDK